jgi:hypothetical protein
VSLALGRHGLPLPLPSPTPNPNLGQARPPLPLPLPYPCPTPTPTLPLPLPLPLTLGADTAYPFPPSGVALVLGNEETGVDTRVMQVRKQVSHAS